MKLYQDFVANFQESYYGYVSAGIIISSCMGAVAAMMILMNGHTLTNMIQLFFVVAVSMGFNAAVLAQLKSKHVVNSFIASCLLSAVLIAVNVPL
ncbi:hypothetical protein RM553_11185 [Zunongwangia sp. F363]|uniref:Uncharacterized protein n=1 Tax=Autumnicola tepida TaxID=3075595 RepID=A0ABU3CAN0_9FLAO|nr:hypothetical protein [Zunongwangia sp. F363]MDT0643395.1 hypothetical protein [Zunongwangia sp. F363]